MQDELASWDAVETAARIAAGEVSAAEVTSAAIERASAQGPELGAIVTACYERAEEQARRVDDDGRRGGAGRFAGVPTFVKDLEDVAGIPTGYGSAALRPAPARSTAASVEQFLSTGVISLGKSTTAEFGLSATTEPVGGAPTRNPVALEHSAGGSSGGAAALVAAGVVPIAHGGDGGGSIRIPAAFCGVVGLKASRGRLVDMVSARRAPVKIATYGVLSRSVRDTAAFYAAIEQGSGAAHRLAPVGLVEGPGREPLRIGFYIDTPLGTAVDPGVREGVLATARHLEKLGHRVEEVAPPYDRRLADDFLIHWGFLAAAVELAMRQNRNCDHTRLEPWTRGLARFFARRIWKLPGAIWRLRRFVHRYQQAFHTCDALLSPVTAAPAPRLGHLCPGQPFETKLERILALLPYTPVQNASGGPAIALPVARAGSGLPVAIQLAAPHGDERTLLELGFALEDFRVQV